MGRFLLDFKLSIPSIQALLVLIIIPIYLRRGQVVLQVCAIEHHSHNAARSNNESQSNRRGQEGSSRSPRKPNIVLIVGDDVGTGDIPGFFDDTHKINMPHLQDMVDNGVVFTDTHSTPLCAPSRYVILSGNYQHRGLLYGGTWKANYKSGQFLDGQQSIAEVLRANNYHTAMAGKWHLGAEVPMKEWYEPGNSIHIDEKLILSLDHIDWTNPLGKGSPVDIGFDASLMTLSGIQDGPYMFLRDGKFENLSNNTIWDKGTYDMPFGKSIIPKLNEGSPSWDSTAFNMLLVNETARFLDDHLENRPDDPFFTYIAMGSVHIPHSPPTLYMDGTPVSGEYGTAHMDLLGELDKAVGSVVQHLEKRGLLDDTIVIFTSDNGGLNSKSTGSGDHGHFSSGPLKGSKGKIDEGGHRVPFIMRWNNGPVPKGETRSRLFGLNDLFATLCQLAGIDVPEGQAMDSVSFADYIVDDDKTDNLREFLGVWTTKDGVVREESIRKNDLKLIRKRQTGELFLYDLDTDLLETKNLVNEHTYKDTVSEMMRELKKISPCYDNENSFHIVGDGGDKEEITCDWFREKPWRCEFHPESKIECRLTCAGRNMKFCSLMGPPTGSPSTDSPTMTVSAQTTSPTSSPNSSNSPSLRCVDSTERFITVKGGLSIRRDCGWVSNKSTNYRCSFQNISTMCPKTCGTCGIAPTPSLSPVELPPNLSCTDSTERFTTTKDGESIRRDCDWVSRKDRTNRCKLPNVSTICRNTCNTCG